MIFLPSPAPAISIRQTVQDADISTWESQRLSDYGTDLLKRGRAFDLSATAFRILTKRSPDNSEYWLALGCACASRHASLSQALRQAQEYETLRQQYNDNKAEWDKAQDDPKNERFGVAPPTPPTTPRTPDDGKKFILSPDQARVALDRLKEECLASFRQTLHLTEKGTPERRAEVEYTKGWAVFLLLRFPDNAPEPERNPANPTAPNAEGQEKTSQTAVTECFQRAADKVPDNPVYWHSLALSFVPGFLEPWHSGLARQYLRGQNPSSNNDVAKATEAMERALKLKPNDFNLLYWAALINAPTAPDKSVSYLDRATRRVGVNALLWYLLAEQRFRQSERSKATERQAFDEKAIEAIEAGNAASQYQSIPLTLPAPPLLKRAVSQRDVFGLGEDARIASALFSQVSSYADDQLEAKKTPEFLHAVQVMLKMGLKVCGSVDIARIETSDPETRSILTSRALMGVANCYRAYDLVTAAQKAAPNAEMSTFLESNSGIIEYVKVQDRRLTGMP